VALGVSLWLLGGTARADHCTGDQSHLSDDSCGYFVQESSPSPTASPSPIPVSVENVPTVKVKPEPDADPITVEVTNWPTPEPMPSPGTDGWNDSDREQLALLVEGQTRIARSLVFAMGLTLFALAGLLVMSLRGRSR
jgi:hypothetical protein